MGVSQGMLSASVPSLARCRATLRAARFYPTLYLPSSQTLPTTLYPLAPPDAEVAMPFTFTLTLYLRTRHPAVRPGLFPFDRLIFPSSILFSFAFAFMCFRLSFISPSPCPTPTAHPRFCLTFCPLFFILRLPS